MLPCAQGPLPASWTSMAQLAGIDASSNGLTGTLPGGWSAFGSLQRINISNNFMNASPAA